MPRTRRCPVCRGPLDGPFGELAAPNRRYCSAACRQEAYRRRAAGVGPAAVRRAASAEQARRDQTAAAVLGILDELAEDLDDLHSAVDRLSAFHRLSVRVHDLTDRVDQLAAAAVAYDRALGATWAELADDTGVDETTLRRRQRRAIKTTVHRAGRQQE